MGATLFDRSVVTQAGMHAMFNESISDSAAGSVHTITMQGNYDSLKEMHDGHYCNEVVTDQDQFLKDLVSGSGDKLIVGMTLQRNEGNVGTLTVNVKLFNRGFYGCMDFETVQKDIRTWRCMESDHPDLGIINLWEQMKESGDTAKIDLYNAFKYEDGNGEEQEIPKDSTTRKLAEMMKRGVETYNEYVPTLQITYNLGQHPSFIAQNFKAGALLGKVVEMSDVLLEGQGFQTALGTNSGGGSITTDFQSMPPSDGVIVCTGDNIQGNADGSYTITRSFSKFRKVEGHLFMKASGGALESPGPYDE